VVRFEALEFTVDAAVETRLFTDSDRGLLDCSRPSAKDDVIGTVLKDLEISIAVFPFVSGKHTIVKIRRPKVDTAKTLNVHEPNRAKMCGKLKATRKFAIQLAPNATVVATPRA